MGETNFYSYMFAQSGTVAFDELAEVVDLSNPESIQRAFESYLSDYNPPSDIKDDLLEEKFYLSTGEGDKGDENHIRYDMAIPGMQEEIDKEELKAYFEDFLDKIEIRSMTKTFTSSAGNILTIDYCYSDGGVLCYPDVIRVAVALDNGEILSYSAYEYVMSHMPSRDVSAKITEAEATANIPSGLELVGARLVVIATNSYSSREKLCWEVTCTNKAGEAVMIYVNALNGRQEDIKILYSNENMSKLK